MTAAPEVHESSEGKHWTESRTRRYIRTSATQHETFDLCPRKWWLEKVRRLPVPQTTSQTFGSVLHAVIERFLRANDLGYDASGAPVELFPQGWTTSYSKLDGTLEGEVTPVEADMIRRLVTRAIEEGVLERRPNRRIEQDFLRTVAKLNCATCEGSGRVYARCFWCSSTPPVWVEPATQGGPSDCYCDTEEAIITCPTCKGDGKGTHVQVTGFIDVLYPDMVEDHKSTKNMRYAKGPTLLARNIQMLIYAKEIIEQAKERGEPPPAKITLRHNVFCKDPEDPRVRKTEVVVTREHVEEMWDKIIGDAISMDKLRRVVNSWHEIPEPRTGAQACNAYGGCQFMSICAGVENEEGYQQRLDRHVGGRYTALTVSGNNHQQQGESTMTTFPQQQPGFAAAVGGVPRPPTVMPMPVAATAPRINPPMPPAGQVPTAPTQPPLPAPAAPQQPAPGPVFAAPAPPPAPAPVPAPVQQQPQQQGPTPAPPRWAVPGCKACGGCGFNTKGEPCRICDAAQAKGNPPGWQSGHFNIANAGTPGVVAWQNKQDPNDWGYSYLAQGEPAPVAAEAREGVAPAGAEDAESTEVNKGGRPPKSFVLVINAVVSRGAVATGDRKVTDLSLVLNEAMVEIAKGSGAASFYDLDPFKRRDVLRAMGTTLAGKFKTSFVVATGVHGESDLRALVDGLLPLAGMVINGNDM